MIDFEEFLSKDVFKMFCQNVLNLFFKVFHFEFVVLVGSLHDHGTLFDFMCPLNHSTKCLNGQITK